MAPALLITFRETIEAALIVAMIAGIFIRLKQYGGLRVVAMGLVGALAASLMLGGGLLSLGSWFVSWYQGKNEELLEGVLAIATAALVTGAVLTLDRHFRKYKMHLISQITAQIESRDMVGIFFITFLAVFREAVEIILLLSSMIFSTPVADIARGFGVGLVGGLVCSVLLMTATIKLPVRLVFRATTILLVFFAAGLLAKGVHELAEYGLIPELYKLKIFFVPARETIVGSIVYALFGLRSTMDIVQIAVYGVYVGVMGMMLREKKMTNYHT